MRLRDIIRSYKENIRFGKWQQGNMQPSAFKLRNDLRTVRQGRGYSWRVIMFEVTGESFRVLILYNPSRSIYRATLGVEEAGVVTILCVHEFHASEPGWHCHADPSCEKDVSHWNHRDLQRWPKRPYARTEYDVLTEDRATEIALRFYRVSERGTLI